MVLLLAAALLPGLQEAERTRVFEATRPSVVALRFPEGHGSGLIVDASGLILTNAHVMIGAEAYTVEVDSPTRAVYRNVKLVGVHPKLDLALVKIDPGEHPLKLQALKRASEAPGLGDPVYAVGFPSSRGGQVKTITGGEVKAVNQYIEGNRYHEVSNEIWTGNSGGPLCNHRGEAVGVITLGITEGLERWGAAVPIDEYRPEIFVSLRNRAPNPAAAHLYLRAAERCLKAAQERRHPDAADYADSLFHLALMHDIANPEAYFQIGLIRRNTGNPKSAAGYLLRSLLMDPAPSGGARHYAELGIAFAQMGKRPEARTIWQEGLRKFPDDSGALWDAAAVDHFDEGRYLDAAVAARASLRKFGPRSDTMNDLYAKSLKRLSYEEKQELLRREGEIDAGMAAFKAEGERARKEGRAFVLPECEKVFGGYAGLQREGGSLPAASRPSAAVDVDRYTNDEVNRLFGLAQHRVALEQLRAGKFAEAEELFAEVVKLLGAAPEADDARRYLKVLREREKK